MLEIHDWERQVVDCTEKAGEKLPSNPFACCRYYLFPDNFLKILSVMAHSLCFVIKPWFHCLCFCKIWTAGQQNNRLELDYGSGCTFLSESNPSLSLWWPTWHCLSCLNLTQTQCSWVCAVVFFQKQQSQLIILNFNSIDSCSLFFSSEYTSKTL